MAKGRRIHRIGKGYFTRPEKIVGGKFNGNVWKKIVGKLTKEQASKNRELHRRYIALLSEAGVRVAKTEIRALPNARGEYSLHIFQEPFKRFEQLDFIFRNSKRKEVATRYRGLVELVGKVVQHNIRARKAGGIEIGIDSKIQNFAFRNGEVILFDTFTPSIQIGGKRLHESLHPHIAAAFSPRTVKRIQKLYEGDYVDEKIFLKLITQASMQRPALHSTFVSITREYIERNFPGEEARKYLREVTQSKSRVNLVRYRLKKWLQSLLRKK